MRLILSQTGYGRSVKNLLHVPHWDPDAESPSLCGADFMPALRFSRPGRFEVEASAERVLVDDVPGWRVCERCRRSLDRGPAHARLN